MYRTSLARQTRLGLHLSRPFSTTSIRLNAGPSYQAPTPASNTPSSSNGHRDFYKSFGRPMAKVFLMAWATYQILHWSWAKLEFAEEKEEKEAELRSVEQELENAVKKRTELESAAATAGVAGVTGDTVAELESAPASKSGRGWKFW